MNIGQAERDAEWLKTVQPLDAHFMVAGAGFLVRVRTTVSICTVSNIDFKLETIPAMTPNLKELAKVGAQARLAEIRDEQAALLAMFPELRGGRARKATAPAPAPKASKARKRPPMSAAQKKAVGERMRKYWAARRAAKPDGAGESAQNESGTAIGAPARKSGRKAGRKQGRKK